MEFDLKTFGLWIAIWVVGYALGLMEEKIRNSNKEKKRTIVDEKIPAPSSDAEEGAVLALYERISGTLRLRIDGEMVEYKSDLDAEKRARLLKLVIALRPWLEKPATVQKPIAPSAPVIKRAKTIPTPPPTPAPEPPTIEFDVDTKAEEITQSKLNMVEQIDRILQKKLEGNPLEKQGIQLRTAISGGLLIQIGLDEYEWIDEIPDQNIQKIIREASAEWDENATPR